ncbi:hypothetical protein GK047_12495 [Paenibacillus sp. SYP-B3998]|uniref:Uncharacterized protein n=1 Tax=Paenibacillus sp. SYP-B3998 TaxID=2678564 RepID=A0A6G3ZXM0_9BACL|nr:hypothetical protein [Paenibacillus sp. SYP-B3998]NEW06830.1 hypothetical protein [Paenibacillus sp. SYP-B3998]
MQAICTVAISPSNKLTLTPVAAVVDLKDSSPQDQTIYKLFLIPKVLQMAATLLTGEQIPNLDFQGVQFGPVVLAVGSGKLVAAASLPGRPVPVIPDLAGFPDGAFTVLLSPDALQQMASRGVQTLQGKSTSTSGSENYGIFKANYGASVTLRNVAVSVNPANLTTVHASLHVAAAAGAGVDVFGAIGDTIADGAKKVADGVVDTANKIADAFSSY